MVHVVALRQALRHGGFRDHGSGAVMATRLLNVSQVAEMLQLHPQTVREMARKGQLPAIKLGGRTSPYRFREAAIDAYLERLERRQGGGRRT